MLLLVVAGMLASLPAMAGGREKPAAAERPPLLVEVRPGETLWAIARRDGNAKTDVRELVWRIEKANDLDARRLEPGTVVLIPPECLPEA